MAHLVLVPGLWLDGSSWDRVVPVLEQAGHTTRPITLPGMESRDADRSRVGLADCVAAVVAAIDDAGTDEPVVVVGHSLGCALGGAAVDARADRVARAVYVGGWPAGDGAPIAEGFATEGDGIPLPDLSTFDDADLTDLDDVALADFRARAIPSPARLTTDPLRLTDERRYAVPVTAVCPEYRPSDLRGWIDGGEESVQELAKVHDVDYVDLPTGHWPQFTKPEELARVLLDAVATAGRPSS
jgi:pimeloyl-ACP methyl ester carboxylesterase